MKLMDKEQKAIERIKLASQLSLQKYGKPLICTYSGGKDSDVLLELFKRSGVPFEAHNSHTTVDAPETVYHIRQVFHDLENEGGRAQISMPRYAGEPTTMWKLIERKRMPPTRFWRYCCQILKEQGGKNRMIATGVRWAESTSRKKRGEFEKKGKTVKERFKTTTEIMLSNDNDEKRQFIEYCELKASTVCNPIIDWSDKEIWNFYYSECKNHNPLYENGYKRVGCIGCPLATRQMRLKSFQDYPKYEILYKHAFKRMLARCDREKTKWHNEEEVFSWWMMDPTIPGQITIDDWMKETE